MRDLQRLLGTPQRGDEVATAYGSGVVKVARGDGTFVVDLGWGICYGIRALRLVARRGGIAPAAETPVVVKKPVPAAPPTVVLASSPRPQQTQEDDASTASLGEAIGPKAPDEEEEEEDDDKERRKQWILEAAKASSSSEGKKKKKVKLVPVVTEEEKSLAAAKAQVCEFVARNPMLCAEKPEVVVKNARRWLRGSDADVVRIITAAFVDATNASVFTASFPGSSSLRLIAGENQRCVIDGLVRFAGDVATVLPRFAVLLKTLYDDDILDEDVILAWGESPTDDASIIAAKSAAAPFLRWLQEAESEDDDDD